MKTFNVKWKSFRDRIKILNGMVMKCQSVENTSFKSTVKILDKYLFKVNKKDSRTTSINIFLLSLFLDLDMYLCTEKIIGIAFSSSLHWVYCTFKIPRDVF